MVSAAGGEVEGVYDACIGEPGAEITGERVRERRGLYIIVTSNEGINVYTNL